MLQLQQTEPEQTPMVQDQTDLFSQQTKQLSSSDRKVHSLELGNLTAYVSIRLIELALKKKETELDFIFCYSENLHQHHQIQMIHHHRWAKAVQIIIEVHLQ